jgi:creatinine amidohydrolase/Fe(II)-dependent formamide hydrolase-like protein
VALSRHISTDQPGSARMIQRHIPLSFSPWDPAHEKLDHSQPPLKSERHQLKHQLSALVKRNKLKRAHDSDGAWSDATNARSESSVKTFRQVVAGAVQGQIQNRSWMRNRARRARITRHIAGECLIIFISYLDMHLL